MKSVLKLSIHPIANLQEEMKSSTLLSIAIGFDNDVLALFTKEQPPLIDGCFPATVTEESYAYQVVHLKDGQKTILNLPLEKWNYHYIQPIDDGNILLVGARSYYHDAGNIEENARVYDENGKFLRSFCLGDGIGHVYVTRNQEIWTGYFDEGVFGNYGWEEPIGSSGLVGWDATGRKIDSLEEDDEYHVFECLALNGAVDGEIFFYFSIESQIGVRKEGRTTYYSPPDMGLQAFAIHEEKFFAFGHIDELALYELDREGNTYTVSQKIHLIKPNGELIQPQLLTNRENKLLFLDGSELYLYEATSGTLDS